MTNKIFRSRWVGSLVVGAALSLVAAASAFASENRPFSGTGTAQGGTNSYLAIPKAAGIPVVQVAYGTVRGPDITNNLASYFKFYRPTASAIPIASAGASGTNILRTSTAVGGTNGLVAGTSIILLEHATGTVERHTISSLGSGAITISGTTSEAVTTLDKVWIMTAVGTSYYANTAGLTNSAVSLSGFQAPFRVSPGGPPLFVGTLNAPALLDFVGSQTNTLNTASGFYWQPNN